MTTAENALRLLDRWMDHAEEYFYSHYRNEALAYYGGGYNAWGVQTNQKFVSAMAVYGAQGPGSFSSGRPARAADMALTGLRFSLHSHIEGPGECADGTSWGHTWISTLGLERMLHALPALLPRLTENDRTLLEKVLCSEAEWLLHDYGRGPQKGVRAELWNQGGGNHPESNIWNGAYLWRTAGMYPDHPGAAAWRERALVFLANGISISNDAGDPRLFDGKPLQERHIGPNFFPNYALDHHGYLNVGYMVICLSNVAMLHFDARAQGFPVPESLYLHAGDLWNVVKKMIFADGRLARIGGDSRVRYAYCQEYLMPTLLFAADRLGDPHALGLLEGQLEWVNEEQESNDDGSFYGTRLAWLREKDPVYYTRLESDRANALGMIADYFRHVRAPEADPEFEAAVAGGWAEPGHGAVLHRSRHRLAAFSWRSHSRGQGMCQPPGDGRLAEWDRHLTGTLSFLGEDSRTPQRELIDHHIDSFDGGFVTQGRHYEGMLAILGEGWRGSRLAQKSQVFAALPDGHTTVGLEFAVIGDSRVWVQEAAGLHFNLPNDLFSSFERQIETGIETILLNPSNRAGRPLKLETDRIVVDRKIAIAGIFGGNGFLLTHPEERSGGPFRSLFVDTIHFGGSGRKILADPGDVVIDAGWMIASHADGIDRQRFFMHQTGFRVPWKAASGRAVEIAGADGRRYRLFANFGAGPAALHDLEWGDEREAWTSPAGGIVKPANEWQTESVFPGLPLLLMRNADRD